MYTEVKLVCNGIEGVIILFIFGESFFFNTELYSGIEILRIMLSMFSRKEPEVRMLHTYTAL
jgi:hypothetical protein